jgi:hypothetical protein
MVNITQLIHEGKLVGYRFVEGEERFDVEIETVHRMGVVLSGVEKSVVLKEVSNLLVSKSEFDSGKLVVDVSNDSQKLNELLSLLNA